MLVSIYVLTKQQVSKCLNLVRKNNYIYIYLPKKMKKTLVTFSVWGFSFSFIVSLFQCIKILLAIFTFTIFMVFLNLVFVRKTVKSAVSVTDSLGLPNLPCKNFEMMLH